MTTFNPRWDLKADSTVIVEGSDTLIRLSINRNDSTDGNEYSVLDNEYLEVKIRIGGTGETYSDSDFTMTLGESLSTLQPVQSGSTGNTAISGLHKIKLSKKYFDLQGNTMTLPVFFINLHCVDDQTWDGPKSISFILESVTKVTITENQISNTEESGTLGLRNVLIAYDDSSEIWVTPGISTGEDNKPFVVSALSYGGNSTIFVQAFGRSRDYNDDTDYDPILNDKSVRVFYPYYQIVPLSRAGFNPFNITGSGTIINPVTSQFPIPGLDKEISLTIEDPIGNIVNTGTKFNPNGQILQTMLYDSEPVDAYYKVRLQDMKAAYVNEKDAYNIGSRFKAYQMWVCPRDTSYIIGNPKPGHLYQLRDNTTYPYVVKSGFADGTTKPLFVESDWNDLGFYDSTLGAGMIGEERIFRILVNANIGDSMQFETDSNLGEIHVGEYFGDSVYPIIKATGTYVSYEITGGRDDIRKYGLDLTADGYLVGTAYARSQDFGANDDIKLEFDVTAYEKSGTRVTGTFKLRIIRGFGENYFSTHLCPSVVFERAWFNCISSPSFAQQPFYRQSDERYGLQRIPRMLMKENFVSQNYDFTTLKEVKSKISAGIVDVINGAPVPEAAFKMVIGNYKIVTALDNNGSLLYDVLYREVHPSGTNVPVSLNPRKYSQIDNNLLGEVFGLRENVYKIVGEDITNLLSDPFDFQNRGLIVPPISGISEEMIDTVPRFMNHPYLEDGVTARFMPIIPVAYFLPGQAEAFFTKLVQNNEHTKMVGTEFTVDSVQFGYFTQQYNLYVHNTFNIPIRSKNLV